MSSIRINLLPHREQQRALQQKTFVVLMAGTVVASLAVIAAGHAWIINLQDRQEARNVFLRAEIVKLDKQIEEIAILKQKTNDLLARKKVVETLQSNRAEAVHLFDELVRVIPDGLYLKEAKQKDNQLALVGYAQSSARVSTFMRNLEASEWLESPRLVEVRATKVNNVNVQEFSLNVTQSPPKSKDPEGTQPKAH